MELVDSNLHLLGCLAEASYDCKRQMIDSKLISLCFQIIEMISCDKTDDEDIGDIDWSVMLTFCRMTNNYFESGQFPRIKKVFKYMIEMFSRLYEDESRYIDDPENEIYIPPDIEMCYQCCEALSSMVSCGAEQAIKVLKKHARFEEFIKLLIKIFCQKV